jgi:hypothetical protein
MRIIMIRIILNWCIVMVTITSSTMQTLGSIQKVISGMVDGKW